MGRKNKKTERLGETNYNNQGCLMKISEYKRGNDIIVEFQDEYKGKVHTTYVFFKRGNVKNPYYPEVYGIGIIGGKYMARLPYGNVSKEYQTWRNMLRRCFDEKYKEKMPTYKNVSICKEWLLYENFYEWLHNQENFNKWYNNNQWHVDKDILIKGNKVYSPDACCLVPQNVNLLFTKCDSIRGGLPIGVTKNRNKFKSKCCNPFTNKQETIGTYLTKEEAFQSYKNYKEDIIKQTAQEEYNKGNITKQCYDAMMNYKVEITD